MGQIAWDRLTQRLDERCIIQRPMCLRLSLICSPTNRPYFALCATGDLSPIVTDPNLELIASVQDEWGIPAAGGDTGDCPAAKALDSLLP